MDLVTLVTACALSVEPKLMHALIWHQSGGEPWAVAVRNEPMPRIYSSMQEAISEAHSVSVANDTVRVGLTGLPVSPLKANAAMFLPCRNVAIAAQRIAKLAEFSHGLWLAHGASSPPLAHTAPGHGDTSTGPEGQRRR